MLQRTPLFASHQQLGGRLVEFGGWEMPVQYSGIVEEHLAVRHSAGIFDIAHMGEVLISGPGSATFLNHILTNDIQRLQPGLGQYTLLPNTTGGTIDDLYAYQLTPDSYLLIINASRIEADFNWLQQCHADHQGEPCTLQNLSHTTGAIAIQGPNVAKFIDRTFPSPSLQGTSAPSPSALRKNQIASFTFAQQPVWIARTGYTGEDGFEIVAPNPLLEGLWSILLEDGKPHGLIPCGLGSRDTLRTEMGYPLYGHELDENTSAIEAGLGAFVALQKTDFVAKEQLAQQKTQGVSRRCVAFKMVDRSPPPRHGYPIHTPNSTSGPIGTVTSGTLSPSLNTGIGLAYVPIELSQPDTPIEIEIRNRRFPAITARKPLYHKPV
jgi:aminomethyltransferase